MTLLDFIRLLLQYKKWLITLPVLVAVVVFVFTISQPKQYTSQALLYTGVVPTSDGALNVQARVDVFAVNNAIDNIQTILLSRQVLQEVSLKMISRHLVKMKSDPKSLESSISKFWSEHSDMLKEIPQATSEEELFEKIQKMNQPYSIRWLLEDDLSIYATSKIKSGLKVKRSGSSDLLEIQFASNEASVAIETLTFLIDSFTHRFKELKRTEVGSMVTFFEKEVAKAAARLSKCAEDMKQFQVQNRIINYYEQTHLTAIETEHLNGQYYDELMKLAASETAFQDLRAKLGDPYQQALSSEEIIQSQEKISRLMTRKQLAFSNGNNYDALNDSIQNEQEFLRKNISKLYIDGRTEEGVSKKEVLKQWLDKFIALSEARARVIVMEKRRVKQEKEYDFFAPLGSVLHNYERQMDVAEREYLDLLHSLNQARLRQQSAENSTTLATVDAPSVPMKPEPSKRKLLVIIGWLGTFILILGVILFVEYFDSTLQSPEHAESKTGLTVLGALTTNPESTSGRVAQSNLLLRYFAIILNGGQSKRILFINKSESVDPGHVIRFAELLHKQNQQVALAGPALPPNDFPVISTTDLETTTSQYDTILSFIPSLAQASGEWSLLKNAEEIVLVINGQHTWTSSDDQFIHLMEKITKRKPYLLLTGIEERRLENWLGELPKQRSRFRRIIKRIIKFQFN